MHGWGGVVAQLHYKTVEFIARLWCRKITISRASKSILSFKKLPFLEKDKKGTKYTSIKKELLYKTVCMYIQSKI